MKQKLKYIGLSIIVLSLSGCWDRITIEGMAYVVAIGMDKGEKENQIEITYLIANPELSKQQGGMQNEPIREVITFNTNNLIVAKNQANSVIPKQISYNLTNAIIVSEELAESKYFLNWINDTTKDREIQRSIPLIVTKEKASKFILNTKPKLETRLHKYFNFILRHGRETGFIPDSTLQKFFREKEADADLFLAIYATTEQTGSSSEDDQLIAGKFHTEGETNKTQFIGSSVFKKGKMIGKLTAEETRIASLLNDTTNFPEIYTTFTDPFEKDYRITARVKKVKQNDIKMDLKKETQTIDVTVSLNIDIVSNQSMVNYTENIESKNKLKKHLEEEITEKINNLVKKTQQELEGEPFGWSLIARKQFATIPEYEAFDWMKSYPDTIVNIKVNIVELGKQNYL